MELPPLPLDEWEETKQTLHRCAQVVGKIRMTLSPPKKPLVARITLYVNPQGLTTGPIPHAAGTFEISFNLLDNELAVTTSDAGHFSFPLDDLPVADFYSSLIGKLKSLGIGVDINTKPFLLFQRDVRSIFVQEFQGTPLLSQPSISTHKCCPA